MKLALYLPNFRDEVTLKELEDLTALAEELDFDSVWTLDRIVVPEASDRAELQYPFGMMTDFPTHAGHLAGQVVPGNDADPLARREDPKIRIGMSIIDTPYRSPACSPPSSPPRTTCPAAGSTSASAPAGCPRSSPPPASSTVPPPARPRTRDDRDHAGRLVQRPVRVPRRVRGLPAVRLRPQAGPEAGPTDLLHRPERPEAVGANESRNTASRAGPASRTPLTTSSAGGPRSSASSARWEEVRRGGFDMCSMIWFVITDEPVDQTPAGKATNLLAGSARRWRTSSSATRRPA